MDEKPQSRWFQFRLRTLLIVVALTNAGFGISCSQKNCPAPDTRSVETVNSTKTARNLNEGVQKGRPIIVPGKVQRGYTHQEIDVTGMSKQDVIAKWGSPGVIFEGDEMPGWPAVPDGLMEAYSSGGLKGFDKYRGLPDGAVSQWIYSHPEKLRDRYVFLDAQENAVFAVENWSDF